MMMNIRMFIESCLLLIILSVILIREIKRRYEKKTEIINQMTHKIVAVLIRHGGKMNRQRINTYLGLPEQMMDEYIARIEKKGVILRKENGDICLKAKHYPYLGKKAELIENNQQIKGLH